MPIRFENAAYEKGFNDYELGLSMDSNPYEEGSDKFVDYKNGWREAKSLWID